MIAAQTEVTPAAVRCPMMISNVPVARTDTKAIKSVHWGGTAGGDSLLMTLPSTRGYRRAPPPSSGGVKAASAHSLVTMLFIGLNMNFCSTTIDHLAAIYKGKPPCHS